MVWRCSLVRCVENPDALHVTPRPLADPSSSSSSEPQPMRAHTLEPSQLSTLVFLSTSFSSSRHRSRSLNPCLCFTPLLPSALARPLLAKIGFDPALALQPEQHSPPCTSVATPPLSPFLSTSPEISTPPRTRPEDHPSPPPASRTTAPELVFFSRSSPSARPHVSQATVRRVLAIHDAPSFPAKLVSRRSMHCCSSDVCLCECGGSRTAK